MKNIRNIMAKRKNWSPCWICGLLWIFRIRWPMLYVKGTIMNQL